MTRNRHMETGRTIATILVLGLLVVATGCSSARRSLRADLPANTQIVGGGFSIDWEAPAKGTVYVVERTSGKILVTEAVDPGESFDFDIDPEDEAAEFKMATGVDLADARIVLYFQPMPR